MTKAEWQEIVDRATYNFTVEPVRYLNEVTHDKYHTSVEIHEPKAPDLSSVQQKFGFQVFALNEVRLQSLRAKRELILNYFLPQQDEVVVSISHGKRPIKEEHEHWSIKNPGQDGQCYVKDVKVIDSAKQREVIEWFRFDVSNEQLLGTKFPFYFKSCETLTPIAMSALCGFVSHNVKGDQISKALKSKGFDGTVDYPIHDFTFRENFLGGWEIEDKSGLIWPCGIFVLWVHQNTINLPEKRVLKLKINKPQAGTTG